MVRNDLAYLEKVIERKNERIAELEAEVEQLRYERAQAGKRAMKAESALDNITVENQQLRDGLDTIILDWQQDGTVYEEYIHALLGVK